MIVGFKLLDKNGTVINSWGGTYGTSIDPPSAITLANGDRVHCPALDTPYGPEDDAYTLTAWEMDPPPEPTRRITPYRIVRRLEEAGLLAAAQALLDANVVFKWRFTTAPDIAIDDADLLAGLQAIGADVDAVLAPG